VNREKKPVVLKVMSRVNVVSFVREKKACEKISTRVVVVVCPPPPLNPKSVSLKDDHLILNLHVLVEGQSSPLFISHLVFMS